MGASFVVVPSLFVKGGKPEIGEHVVRVASKAIQVLANRRPDFVERFRTFYQRRPHPVYVRVPGVPAWTDLPAYATEFTITPKDIEDILAFAKTLKRK